MKSLIWHKNGTTELVTKPKPTVKDPKDAIVRVTLSSICTSDLHIIKGFVPKAVPETTLGHEFVGEVVEVGSDVKTLKVGDRVAANCETFCGQCYFCKRGFVNNCEIGGWMLGCSMDGCQAEFVRVPYADCGLYKLPENVTYDNALFVGDILVSGYWGAKLCEIKEGDTVAVLGAGPVGLCAMNSARSFNAGKIVAIDVDNSRLQFALSKKLADYAFNPNECDVEQKLREISESKKGADSVIEAAGGKDTFQIAWKIARPNAIVAVVAMYEENQTLPLPHMYGKNLIFKTGGVDANNCRELLQLISEGKINTDFLITQKYPLSKIQEAYKVFESKEGNCLKIAITPD